MELIDDLKEVISEADGFEDHIDDLESRVSDIKDEARKELTRLEEQEYGVYGDLGRDFWLRKLKRWEEKSCIDGAESKTLNL